MDSGAETSAGGPLKRASSAESFASETELHRVELEREFSGFRTEQLECLVQYLEYALVLLIRDSHTHSLSTTPSASTDRSDGRK